MPSTLPNIRSVLLLGLANIVLLALPASASSPLPKLTPAEIVAKHLESIGSANAREGVKTRLVTGTAQVIFRSEPSGQAIGRVVLASEGRRHLVGMSFPSPVYPREHLGFNGDNFMAAFATPGTRSMLGGFLMTNQQVFKEGLMGGVLSAAWPLFDLQSRHARIEYAGTKTIDDHVLYELAYRPRGGADLKIRIYFDTENFRHVRTEYERLIPAQMDTRSMVNVQTRESRYLLVENFSLFKQEGELTLPHIYTIKLAVDTQNGTFLAEWTLKLTRFSFNEKIDPASFSISAG